MRRPTALALALVVLTATAACGLGEKESMADAVEAAMERLEARGTVLLDMEVAVRPLKRPDTILEQTPRIVAVPPVSFSAIVDLRRDAAAVAIRDNDPSTAALVFRDTRVFQRIAPKSTGIGTQLPTATASNLAAINAVLSPAGAPIATEGGEAASTTATTEPPSALRRTPRIPRVWVSFDYAELDEKDPARRAGSYAINPRDILRLVHGLLTGSIERKQAENGLVVYEGNVSRDKAERRLSEERRELLDKVFRANAVSGRTFSAGVFLDGEGELRGFHVRMRQQLTNIDKADLIIRIGVAGPAPTTDIARPDPKATARVGSLGQLVTTVTRT